MNATTQWSAILVAIALLIGLGFGIASISANVQEALRDLENIQLRMLPVIDQKIGETNARIDREVNRSRDLDTEMFARMRLLERNMTNMINYAAERARAIEEIMMRIDPKVLGPEYKRLRERDKFILPQFIPPSERHEEMDWQRGGPSDNPTVP